MLSDEEEQEIVDYLILCATSGVPKTRSEIIRIAGEVASLNPDPVKHFKNEKPSKKWFKTFVLRHPELSKRKPEMLGRASAGVTEQSIRRYFELVHKQFEDMNQLELFDQPSQWWNCDETNFPENPMPGFVYAERGAKVVYNVERGRPKANTTCTYAFSADGSFIEPLITFENSVSSIVDIAYAMGCKFSLNLANFNFLINFYFSCGRKLRNKSN